MQTKKYTEEAGPWHHLLVQELRKKQNGEDYHGRLVAAALRHIRHYCSAETFAHYQDVFNGATVLQATHF